MAKKNDVRIYLINKPAFLSCGKAYFTDRDNKILLTEDYKRPTDTPLFKLRTREDIPYTLCPYPLSGCKPGEKISIGRNVYPSCDVDPMGPEPKRDEIPKVIDFGTISINGLEEFIKRYTQLVQSYRGGLNQSLRHIDEMYRLEKRAIEIKIQDAKKIVRKRYTAPSLVDLILEKDIPSVPEILKDMESFIEQEKRRLKSLRK